MAELGGDATQHLLLPDRHQVIGVSLEAFAEGAALGGVAFTVTRVGVAPDEVDVTAAALGAAAARIALGLVQRDPTVENRDFFAGKDRPFALNTAGAVGVDGGVRPATVVTKPAARHARVGHDDPAAFRDEREFRVGSGGRL